MGLYDLMFMFESFVLYKWGVVFKSNYNICGDVSIISADDSVVDDDDYDDDYDDDDDDLMIWWFDDDLMMIWW